MDITNMESLMSLFRELTTEMPQVMIYRESGDCIELRSLDNLRDSQAQDLQVMDRNPGSCRVYAAA